MPSLALGSQRTGQTPRWDGNPAEASSFRLFVDTGNLGGNPKASNHSNSLTPGGRISIVVRAGATGLDTALATYGPRSKSIIG